MAAVKTLYSQTLKEIIRMAVPKQTDKQTNKQTNNNKTRSPHGTLWNGAHAHAQTQTVN